MMPSGRPGVRRDPIKLEYKKGNGGYSKWLMSNQPQLIEVNPKQLCENRLPDLPDPINRRIWKESNDMLLKEKIDYCRQFNQKYVQEDTLMKFAVRHYSGRLSSATGQTIRRVVYTMDGGEVWEDQCLLGNCPNCFAAGPILYLCRNPDCLRLDNRFRLIRFSYWGDGGTRFVVTDFVHPYQMANFAGKSSGMFNLAPLPPPLNKHDPLGLSVTHDDIMESMLEWSAQYFLQYCFDMNLDVNKGQLYETGPYRWMAWLIQHLKAAGFPVEDIHLWTNRGNLLAAARLLKTRDNISITLLYCLEHILRNLNKRFELKNENERMVRSYES